MSRSSFKIMWAEAPTVLVRGARPQREVFRLTDGGWEPPVDILVTKLGLVVVVALPGVRRDEMEIAIESCNLMVRGTRRWPEIPDPVQVHRMELPHGHFERRLPLPQGSYQIVRQEHSDGCLILTLKRLA